MINPNHSGSRHPFQPHLRPLLCPKNEYEANPGDKSEIQGRSRVINGDSSNDSWKAQRARLRRCMYLYRGLRLGTACNVLGYCDIQVYVVLWPSFSTHCSQRRLSIQALVAMDENNSEAWKGSWNDSSEVRALRKVEDLRREIHLLQASLRELEVVEQEMVISWAEPFRVLNRERERLRTELGGAERNRAGDQHPAANHVGSNDHKPDTTTPGSGDWDWLFVTPEDRAQLTIGQLQYEVFQLKMSLMEKPQHQRELAVALARTYAVLNRDRVWLEKQLQKRDEKSGDPSQSQPS